MYYPMSNPQKHMNQISWLLFNNLLPHLRILCIAARLNIVENEIEEKVLCQVALFGIFLATSAHIFFLALATLLISQFPRGHATKDPPSTGGLWLMRLLVLGKIALTKFRIS